MKFMNSDVYKNVISRVTTNYSSIFIVNLSSGMYDVIKVYPAAVEFINRYTNAVEGLAAYARAMVMPDYHHSFMKFISPDYVIDSLRNHSSVSFDYRSSVQASCWRRAHWFALDNVNGFTQTAVFAVEDVNENKLNAERLQQQLAYIKGLISGYDILMICNAEKDIIHHTYYCSDIPDDKQRKPIGTVECFSKNFAVAMRAYCHPDFYEMMINYADINFLRQLMRNKKRHSHRFLSAKPDGGYHWIEMTIIKFASDNEPLVDFSLSYTNVDSDECEKRDRQAALEDVTNIIHSSEMGMWHITLVQGRAPKMSCDDKMKELLGLGTETVLSDEDMYNAWFSRVKPEAVPSVNASVMRMITEGVRDENTYLWIHPTKGERYVRCGGTAVPVLGGHLLSGYHYDVTEHVLAEMNQKRITEEALAANKAKTVFLHNMIHEIRTPLNAIMGFAQLLAMPDGTWSDADKEQHIKQINNGYNILNMLIEDVLDIADSDHGNYIVNIDKVNVNSICRNAIQAAEFRKPSTVNMYFTSNLDDNYTIESDGRRITQVLFNYLNNACKHTRAGEIHLHCSDSEHPGHLTFSVADTGEGVPPEMAKDIFKRFTKHNSLIQGSGLGLNICSVVAEKLNGQVYLDTDYTNGARFVFVL